MTTSTAIAPRSLQAWILASRLRTLPAAAAPVVVGMAVAYVVGAFRFDTALAALLGACLIQIGTNFANDVFDAEKGADTEERVGPTRAVQSGLLSARDMRIGMVAAFALASLTGIYLTMVGGWPIIAIGIASILSGIAYTGGPFPLGYHGLGDLFVFVFFGLVAVTGTVYVQALEVPPLAWLVAIPVGALSTAILVVNNVRDRLTDVKAGKRTLAVRFGRRFGESEYILLLVTSYVVPVGIALSAQRPWVLLPLFTIPRAVMLTRELRTLEGPPLNATLAGTAKLLMLHSFLFSLGLILPRLAH